MSRNTKTAELELKTKRQAEKIHALIQKNKKLKKILAEKNKEIKKFDLNKKYVKKKTSLSRMIKNIGDNNV